VASCVAALPVPIDPPGATSNREPAPVDAGSGQSAISTSTTTLSAEPRGATLKMINFKTAVE
jgi:hypothetical protein